MQGRMERCTAGQRDAQQDGGMHGKMQGCTAGWGDAQQDGGMHSRNGAMQGRDRGMHGRDASTEIPISGGHHRVERYPARMMLVQYGGTHGWAGIASRVVIGARWQ